MEGLHNDAYLRIGQLFGLRCRPNSQRTIISLPNGFAPGSPRPAYRYLDNRPDRADSLSQDFVVVLTMLKEISRRAICRRRQVFFKDL